MFRPTYSQNGELVTITTPDGTKMTYTAEDYRRRMKHLEKCLRIQPCALYVSEAAFDHAATTQPKTSASTAGLIV